MGLFGKKKEQNNVPAENKTNNSVSDEMKIILAAREEAKQEKKAKAEERQQAQEKADKEEDLLEEQARMAAEKVLTMVMLSPAGMTFYVICDEIDLGAVPEKEGNIIIRGNVRGTVKADRDVFLYQGEGGRYKVRIEKIRSDNREFVNEITNARAEIEITRGEIPAPTDPDADASRPVDRFAVLTDAAGIEDTKDPSCKGLAIAGNPRTIAMLCEYGKFGGEDLYTSAMLWTHS